MSSSLKNRTRKATNIVTSSRSQTSTRCSPTHPTRRAEQKPPLPLTPARLSSSRMWPSSRRLVPHPLDACTKITCTRFQAMLRYLYTDEIEFAPWGSVERRKAHSLKKISESYGIPRPSPKSVYRLADKVTSSHLCLPPTRTDAVFSTTYPS